MSGTGSDGSRGALALNESGGFVLAQTPEEAAFDGMPQSVINTGIVDKITGAKTMPAVIARYLSNKIKGIDERVSEPTYIEEDSETDYDRILAALNEKCGVKFSSYKTATVFRRIERRMQVKHLSDIRKYAELVEKDPLEIGALQRELFISVTSFFRDRETFRFIQKNIITKLVNSLSTNQEVRVWVAGCSTGEEVYSYAILLEEAMKRRSIRASYKIFATDVNPDVIEVASRGTYPESAITEIHSQYLDDYFSKGDGTITVAPLLRQKVVFAVHNLLADAPFTNMDIVSCRNTLIYFKNDAQKEALQRLQFAVKQYGSLILGKSESISINSDYFKVIDRAHKVFTCIQKTPPSTGVISRREMNGGPKRLDASLSTVVEPFSAIKFAAEAQINNAFVPLSLLVNNQHEVIHIFGKDTSALQLKAGTVNFHISNVLPSELSPVAVALLYRLGKEDGELNSDKVKFVKSTGKSSTAMIKGWRVDSGRQDDYFILSLIVDDSELTKSEHVDISAATLERVQQLEVELKATRESLQSTIEELETTNEELQATNEELMASNEELQSSNEELQSVNEELSTVNAQYHEKVNILNSINADLDAISLSTGIATIFVDDKQHLTRFTPDAREIFKVRDQDIGRPINEIVNNLNYESFFDDIALTVSTGRSKEVEILGQKDKGYLMRIVSYRLPSAEKFGAVISLIESKSFGTYQTIIDSLPEHVAVLDQSGNIVVANEAWRRFAIVNSDFANSGENYYVGCNYLDVCSDELKHQILKILSGESDRYSLKYPCHSPTEKRWYIMEVRGIRHSVFKAVVSHRNVTQWEINNESNVALP